MVHFNVSLKQIGWEKVVIAPKHLPVTICIGICSNQHLTFDVNVLILQQLNKMFLSQDGRNKPYVPCCAATSYTKVGAIILNAMNRMEHVSLELIADNCVCL